MDRDLPNFSESQWRFLSLLEAFRTPVHIDVVGSLVPLEPGALLEILQRGEELGWLIKTDGYCFSLASDVPAPVMGKLKSANNQDTLEEIVEKLKKLSLLNSLDPDPLVHLFCAAGRDEEAARLQIELAHKALKNGKPELVFQYLKQASPRIYSVQVSPETDSGFLSTILELSNFSFAAGKGVKEMVPILEKGLEVAGRLGNQRQWALMNLHLGRLFYYSDRRSEALDLLSAGKKKVEELGDSDIMDQSAEFLGLYYYMHGLFAEASKYFERATRAAEIHESELMNSLSPGFLAYCETYLGQYHRAVGTLDCYWHTARQKGNQSMAVNFRATLGVVLLLINRKKEGIYHLNAARKEAEDCKNFLALYIILGGLAYSHYLEGDPRKAFDLLISGATIAADAGIIRQYSSPWVLEMLYDLERNGYILPGSTFQDLFDRLMKEPNVHLRGVGLRLKAKELASRGEHKELIMENLLASQDYLQQSGDPVQLGKTRLDLALLKLSEGKLEESRLLAQKARQGLSGFWEESFPDALRFLLEKEEPVGQRQVSSQEILKRFLEINEELVPKSDLEELMGQLVSAMNRFFMAERGGLFWFSGKNSPPVLKAGRNLTQSDVFSESFRPSLALVIKAYRENRSLLVRPECSRHKPGEKKILASLSIPFEMNGQVRGVLYHDNSYLDNCFDFAKGPLLNMLTRHLSTYTEKIWKYRWMVQEAKNSALGKSAQIEALDKGEILGGSEIMEHILTQADRVAQTGATVLIIGETGSGKELLARRIHQKSHRSQEPFIIVDPTTIPDNLVESDLFGHEKGAFTGADRQKAGRLELAHGGTLFVDEIGEIPKHIQGKFLRVLEDKSFVRVGGTRRIVSDFRLLAATNRDLAKEVAAGRFREDLYYRINIFGLKLPPLRERPEDIALLANHYLAFFARKYNYPHLRLSAAEEEILISYTWPGNVRELKNEMERAVLSSDGERLELNLPKQADLLPAQSFNDGPTLDEVERRYIQSVLEKTGGKISGPMGAAKLLGMKRTTLHSRLKKLGLR